MTLVKPMAVFLALALLAGCGGGMEIGGGPAPDSADGQMLAADPSAAAGQMDDTTGTPIPGN